MSQFERPVKNASSRTIVIILLVLLALFFTPQIPSLLTRLVLSFSMDKASLFATVFLGIFIEALPFLLLGTLASGAVEVFVNPDVLRRIVPGRPLSSALVGGLMGLLFPVCECGVVPLVRRLFRKGLPLPAGISLLLAGPVLNPVVILSTAAAFGFGQVLFLRLIFTFGIAVITGLVFSAAGEPGEILKDAPRDTCGHDHHHAEEGQPSGGRLEQILRVFVIAQGEFFEMGRYLVVGGLLAAAMQTFVPQDALLDFARGPVLSVLGMMILAVVLSVCSTVDSFIALGFANTFSLGAVLGFLVFGPMVDIKSALMYWRVFRGRAPAYLVLIPFFLSLLAGAAVNFLLG